MAFGDQRAWDARVRHRTTGVEFVVEAETRLHDVQALLRRLAGKRQVAPVRVILLVAATRNNRSVLEFAGETMRTALPTDMRACLAALKDGRLPPADGIIVLETGARAEVALPGRSSGSEGPTRPAGRSSGSEGPTRPAGRSSGSEGPTRPAGRSSGSAGPTRLSGE